MQYRRDYTTGASYFFTVVMFRRLPLLGNREAVDILREAIRAEKSRRPFQIDAMVTLPDHIHAIWTLPVMPIIPSAGETSSVHSPSK
jgi:putative transposase